MSARSFDRRTLALSQLEAALRLYSARADLLAVITLAGAAEELLGKIARDRGLSNSVESLAEAAVQIDRLLGLTSTVKEHIATANRARDALKHLGDGREVSFDPAEEAADMLQRAVSNFWTVESTLTAAMEQFERERRAT